MQVNTILCGDSLEVLRTLPDQSVHCCISSPPYYALRNYNVEGQIGLEATPLEYISKLVAVFREVYRVLRPEGSLWINIADTYANDRSWGGHASGKHAKGLHEVTRPRRYTGLPLGNLIGIPWRLAFALQDEGWILRRDIIWSKGNVMPESVTNRPTSAHEYIFLLTKQPNYYYDAYSSAEPSVSKHPSGNGFKRDARVSYQNADGSPRGNEEQWQVKPTRNRRSVWNINTEPFPDAHFACVDEETECLTLTGWKKYTELYQGELLASYDISSGLLQYEPLKQVAVYDYDGDLYKLGGRDLGVLCTPNHRCIVKTRAGNVSIRRADELVGGLSVPCAANWVSGIGQDKCAPNEIVAELLGWALTEGNWNNTSVTIYQSLTANPHKVDHIRTLLDNAGFKYVENVRTRQPHMLPQGVMFTSSWQETSFSVTGYGYRVLRELASADDPNIPWRATLWPNTIIEALLRGIILGDGHTRKDDGRWSVIQKDKSFIDMVQILAFRLGYRCIVSPRKARDRTCYTAFIVGRQWHSLRGTNGIGAVIDKIPYHGKVWCPSLSSGTFVARRGGRIWITGNTMPRKLVEPCILAGSSSRCCPACGAPWQRIIVATGHINKREAAHAPLSCSTKTDSTGWAPTRCATEQREPTCSCSDNTGTGRSIILDPFAGAGTVPLVAMQNNRDYVGIELNPEYIEMANRRLATVQPVLWEE